MCLIMVSQSCLLPMSVIIMKLLNDQRKTNTCLSMNIIIRRALSSTGLSLITFFHLHNVNNLSEQNCSLAKSLTSRRNCPDIPPSSSSSSCFCCCVLMSVRLSGFLERPCHVYRCISTRWKFRMKQDYYFFREIPCMEPMFPLSCARVCAHTGCETSTHK